MHTLACAVIYISYCREGIRNGGTCADVAVDSRPDFLVSKSCYILQYGRYIDMRRFAVMDVDSDWLSAYDAPNVRGGDKL